MYRQWQSFIILFILLLFSKERAASVLLQDQGFKIGSLEFMLSGEGPRGGIVKHKKKVDIDFSFRKCKCLIVLI